ncbi:MAG: ATP-binding protein [Ruminococcus flavefaciens]|nr:ATP-binding protein [Ruminococcus flavefaciens]
MIEIGRVYGETINTVFMFATLEYYKKTYVQIIGKNEEILLGKITEKKVENTFLSSPQVVKYIDNTMDLQQDTIYTCKAIIIGTIENGTVSLEDLPALPGSIVYEADPDMISLVYGIETTKVKIGYLRSILDCSVFLDINKIFNPHMTVIGKTGSGKSYFVKGLLHQMSQHSFYVFSPSDEYNDIIQKEKSELYNEITLPLNTENLTYFLNLNITEETILQKIDFAGNRTYSTQEIIAEIISYYKTISNNQQRQMRLDLGVQEQQEIQLPQYALSLIQKIRNLKNIKFTKRPSDIIQMRKSTIFDMSEYSQIEQECILNYYLYRIYKKCRKSSNKSNKKHIIFIEEAHNFVPSVKNTLCKDIIVKLAREGRKFGICLCFITQRPRNFDQTALSQSSNKIVFSVPHPDDVKYVLDDAVFYNSNLAATIPRQRQGQCVIIGDAFRSEIEVQIAFDEK